ncbi:hypothetical protein B9Z55_018273 [Caenorhabditis nigoni]|uniref:Uncharacterized protein n=1 Tax=Caenorhabditis nigoni TaxID=1611254 RepID=A0A2G5TD49_9PELO|nr:hypothetical protein B9Z55_018273 [Caenorhabditis nigoni]
MATTPSPKRRQRREVFLLNNWLMKPIVTLKRTGETLCYCYYRERAPCQASYALDETNKAIRIIEEHSGHEQDMLKFQVSFFSDIRKYYLLFSEGSGSTSSSQTRQPRNLQRRDR